MLSVASAREVRTAREVEELSPTPRSATEALRKRLNSISRFVPELGNLSIKSVFHLVLIHINFCLRPLSQHVGISISRSKARTPLNSVADMGLPKLPKIDRLLISNRAATHTGEPGEAG